MEYSVCHDTRAWDREKNLSSRWELMSNTEKRVEKMMFKGVSFLVKICTCKVLDIVLK